MSRQIDGVWNTDPDMDRLERQREAELDAQDCTGGVHPAAGLMASEGKPEITVKRCVALDLDGYEAGMTDDGINFTAEGRDGLALTSAQAREIAAALTAAADEWDRQ